ncbi:MAG: hypothetical protein AAF267_20005 [Deinococcota bacterium]
MSYKALINFAHTLENLKICHIFWRVVEQLERAGVVFVTPANYVKTVLKMHINSHENWRILIAVSN